MEPQNKKLKQALEHLDEALKLYQSKKSVLNFMLVSKAFEVAVEYGWRVIKAYVENDGLEAPSPKQAVKQGARLDLIDKPDRWMLAIDARNNSVHDYFGISQIDYADLADEFSDLLRALIKKVQPKQTK